MTTPPSPDRKVDMFDVAHGRCQLEDFLLTRFSPQDLGKKVQVDPNAGFQEFMAPPKPPKPPAAPAPLFPAIAADKSEKPAAPPAPVDLQKLIASFHEAAKDYTQRAHWEKPEPPRQ